MMFSLNSCHLLYDYSGKYPDLFTEATSSLLGITSNSDPHADDHIEILETDSYGRKLAVYIGDSNLNKYIICLLISQKTEDDYVYYYSDKNFIFQDYNKGIKIETYDDIKNYCTQDQINTLKENNDWEQELNLDECINKKIYRKKPEILSRENVIKKFKIEYNSFLTYIDSITYEEYLKYLYENGILKEDEYQKIIYEAQSEVRYLIWTDLLTTDLSNNSIYNITLTGKKEKIIKSVILFFDKDGNIKDTTGVEEIIDPWDYADQLREFKIKNGWKET